MTIASRVAVLFGSKMACGARSQSLSPEGVVLPGSTRKQTPSR